MGHDLCVLHFSFRSNPLHIRTLLLSSCFTPYHFRPSIADLNADKIEQNLLFYCGLRKR